MQLKSSWWHASAHITIHSFKGIAVQGGNDERAKFGIRRNESSHQDISHTEAKALINRLVERANCCDATRHD